MSDTAQNPELERIPKDLPYEGADPALADEEMVYEADLFEDPILERFCKKNSTSDQPDFRSIMQGWGEPFQKAFSRLASAVHSAGLDWWHIDPTKNHQIRFGRKDIGSIRAKKTIAYIEAKQLTIRSAKSGKLEVGSFGAIPLQEFDIKFMERLSNFFEMNVENSPIASRANRKAYWPDEIGIHKKDDGRDEDENDEDESKERASAVQTPMNRIYYGPPGTGKTHRLNPILEETYGKPKQGEPELEDKDQKKRYAFVTFHQSYGYEEFVEGLRPVLDEASAEGGQVRYEIRAGVFKALCEKARDAKKEAKAKGTPDAEIPRYAMVIDEINRGNISKIFGELITLIEDDKREGEKNAIAITLPYSGESFSVPANVDIIGTMNTADRSLALLDTALRRRFEFVPMLPDTRNEEGAPLHKLKVEGIDIRLMLETMNKRIEVLYDRDHCIGHAYFTKLKGEGMATLDELGKIFKNRIIPLLEEYFFEDWNKIRLVLGDKSKTDDAQFIHETKMDSTELTDILGANHGLESDNLAPRYEINPDAFENISAYTGIYASPKAHKSPASTEADAE